MTDDSKGPYLDAIEAREEAATPGPWELECDIEAHANVLASYSVVSDGTHERVGESIGENDAVFIAAARTDVLVLCREVRRLRGRLVETAGAKQSLVHATKECARHLDELDTALARAEANWGEACRERAGRQAAETAAGSCAQWRANYFMVADAIAADSAGAVDLVARVRAYRADVVMYKARAEAAEKRAAELAEPCNMQALANKSAKLSAQLAQVQGQVAVMREALEGYAHDPGMRRVEAALATDAGQTLLAEMAVLRELAKAAVHWATTRKEVLTGVAPPFLERLSRAEHALAELALRGAK